MEKYDKKSKAIVITAPDEIYSIDNENNVKLFLCGGIVNCPEWQTDAINWLENINGLTIYNPRRKDFPINDPKASEQQITWEFVHLKKADVICFWFSEGSLNSIVLYELGMWGNSKNTPTVIGTHPNYERKINVILQMKLAKGKKVVIRKDFSGFLNGIETLLKKMGCYR